MPDHDSSITHAITGAAQAIHHSRTLDETLHAIVRAAQQSIPGFDHAGLSVLHGDGRVETLASTGHLVEELDSLQYELGEGPCVDTLRGDRIVVVEHAHHDQRWPSYMPAAARAGLRAQLALRLYVDEDKTVGGLNLYSTRSATIDEGARHVAELFATHATIALGRVQELEQLNEALQTRKVIGQALGLLMARYDLDEDRAFDFMVRASSTGNAKLRVVAQELVDDANRRARSS